MKERAYYAVEKRYIATNLHRADFNWKEVNILRGNWATNTTVRHCVDFIKYSLNSYKKRETPFQQYATT